MNHIIRCPDEPWNYETQDFQWILVSRKKMKDQVIVWKLKSFRDGKKDEQLVGTARQPNSYQGELFLTI
jgi:hypothetical protein